MGDRTVIEKFHKKKNEKYLFKEKLIVLFWDFFFNVFLFFFLFLLRYTCYPAFCYVSELVTFPCTARDRDLDKLSLQWTRNRCKRHLFYKGDRKSLEHVHCSSKTSMDSSSRRPQVMAENQKIRSENEKARLLSFWSSDDFFLSISFSSSNVDKLWTFFVCLKTERDHMFRPGLAAKSLVIDAFVTIHLDL